MLTYSLPLKWKKTIKLASGVGDAQAVVVGGKVYIGGGRAKGSNYKILEYTIEGGQWWEIETPVEGFGMAVVNDQVIITGGWIEKIVSLTRCGYWIVSLTHGHSHSPQCLLLGHGSQQWATRGGYWWWGEMMRNVWRY